MRRRSSVHGEDRLVEDRFGLVFVLLLISYVLSAFISALPGRVIALGLYVATLFIAMRAAGFSRRTARGLSTVIVVASLSVLLLVILTPDDVTVGLVASWTAALTLTTLCVVVVRILHHDVVSFQTVLGALSAYLLIGFMFTSLYAVTASWIPGPFFAGGAADTSANLQYFSFVTLTTTGYGDLTAGASLGRALAVMEALLGQIFLVTLVARLVSVFGTTRSASAPAARPGRSARREDSSPGGQDSSPASRDQV